MTRETSIEAYNKMKNEGLLSSRRWQVYDVLFKYGPMTTNELFKKLMGSSSTNQPSLHSRLNELRKMGCVKELGTKVCTVTQMTVILWDVTSNLPTKFEKAKRIKCPHCDGKGYVQQEQARLF